MNATTSDKIDYAAHWTVNAESFAGQACYPPPPVVVGDGRF